MTIAYSSPSPLQSLVSAPVPPLQFTTLKHKAFPDVCGLIYRNFSLESYEWHFFTCYRHLILQFPINTLNCKIYSLVIPSFSSSSYSFLVMMMMTIRWITSTTLGLLYANNVSALCPNLYSRNQLPSKQLTIYQVKLLKLTRYVM
jgi:hypothetical protein